MRITVLGLGGKSVFMRVQRFHRPGETLAANSIYTEPGGKGYNQAVAAARLGANVSYIGAFGNDADSAECIEFLKREGVQVYAVIKDIPCAYACIQTDSQGENRVTVFGGASSLLTDKDIARFCDVIAASDMLLLQNEVPRDANRAAFDIARSNDVKILYNPAPAVNADEWIVKNADIITPNEHEATVIFGHNYKEGIEKNVCGNAVVTLGAEGAACYDGAWYAVPTEKVTALDTTGSGDCFNGALAVALCKGTGFYEACIFAAKAATRSVTKPHAVASMPYYKDIID